MKAVVVDQEHRLAVLERPEPEPGDHVLVRVLGGGICGTDLKIVHGEVPFRAPVILGHEVVGLVEASGQGSDIPAGSRVVLDPSVSCGQCPTCRRDLPHLCPRGGLMGRDSDGGFAELIAVPDSRLHVLPAELSDADALLLQALSTCVHAQARLELRLGQVAVVVGLGVTGLMHVRLLLARGMSTIVGVSRSAAKRSLATKLGATACAAPSDALELVADLTGGAGADIVIESAGQRDALVQACAVAGLGGTVMIFGTISPTADGLPTYEWYRKELTLLTSRAARPRDFTAAISAVRDGLIRPGSLITSEFALADVAAAIEAAEDPAEIKVVLTGAPAREPGADGIRGHGGTR